jgi:hypothetical protein
MKAFELKKCPICKRKFSVRRYSSCYRTCGRPCSIVLKARQRVGIAKDNLEIAKDRLRAVTKKFRKHDLPEGREKAL